ncbi:MAG: RNA 3'-terminal phosphate cyclase [Euryarchaeota archaeon]|nr:RNA 3'-terminal phosphate cyclase [Euryarchaeota archaeon]
MAYIDGSYGEGGGQILRTAVALAGITGKDARIINIRAQRKPPGLKNQHLTALLTACDLCNATVEGAELGSKEVIFKPKQIIPGAYTINIGTAGSITLLLQTLIPIAAFSEKKVLFRVKGGTNVRWSPSIEYFSEVFLYFLRMIGIETELELLRHGFYPKGGGEVKLTVYPWKKRRKMEFTERGKKEGIKAISIATQHLRDAKVAERQVKGFRRGLHCKKELKYMDSYSIGSSITGLAEFGHTRMGGCSFGKKGKRAEIVGKEAAEELKKELNTDAALDRYMGDQIIPYLGLAGGKITVSAITNHLKTNCRVVEQFLPVEFRIEGNTVEAIVQE